MFVLCRGRPVLCRDREYCFLLIQGCGRTATYFQGGSANKLYELVSPDTQLFTLPPKTTVYPALDYKGGSSSTIGAEIERTPRLSKAKRRRKTLWKSWPT
jgi:hypothetical protein